MTSRLSSRLTPGAKLAARSTARRSPQLRTVPEIVTVPSLSAIEIFFASRSARRSIR